MDIIDSVQSAGSEMKGLKNLKVQKNKYFYRSTKVKKRSKFDSVKKVISKR